MKTGYLSGIGRIAGRQIAYVRWSDGTISDYTLSQFKKTFGVPAKHVESTDVLNFKAQER